MKTRFLVLAATTALLTACAPSEQQKADYSSVQRSGVNSAVYDKMMHGDKLSVGDIIALSQARVSDAVMTRYVRDHYSVYNLTRSDVSRLQQGGVSQSVIDFMLHSGYRSPDSPWGP